jgi:soluble lytic murein transglycosylase-like protein
VNRSTPQRDWGLWVLGFLAGAAVATWITLSTHPAGAQSPEVQEALVSASDAYGVPYTTLARVAWCESRFVPGVDNFQGSGARGLFQFMPGTYRWMSAQAGYAGTSPYDPWAAAHVAAWAFSRGYGPQHWKACW